MKTIAVNDITNAVRLACIEACYQLPEDAKSRIESMREAETFPPAKQIMDRIVENYQIASEGIFPICQDTGMGLGGMST